MVIVDLATYLESQGFTNVQQFALQPEPDAAIALVGYGGREGEFAFGSETPVTEAPRVQVQVRGAQNDPQEPGERAHDAWQALHLQLRTLSGTLYRRVRPLQPPYLLKQDTNRRFVWIFNVEAEAEL